jgi:hypothetical protein
MRPIDLVSEHRKARLSYSDGMNRTEFVELLRDPAWQFVGAVLTVLVAVAVYLLQRQTKELTFGLLSSRRPLSIDDEISSRVTVQLDGAPIGNLHLLVFGFKNSGNKAVLATDFERPLSVSFGDGTVVSAVVAAEKPANLGAGLHVAKNSVRLEPLLLNAGDLVLFQVLVSSKEPDWTCDARIIDVPKLARVDRSEPLPPFFKSVMFPILLTMWAVALFMHGLNGWVQSTKTVVYIVSVMSGMSLLIRTWEVFRPASRRRITE